MTRLSLRALNPQTEIDLFREAYAWRTSPKRNTRINRMSFEEFAADYNNKVVMGLFGDRLEAVYVFIEVRPQTFEAHFTSRKDASHVDVFAGARTLVDWFHSQGAVINAQIVERNKPLRAFVEALGFTVQNISCQEVKVGSKLTLVKYVSQGKIPP